MLPVIIAGAGPIGLALALALSGHGVPSLVLDSEEGPPPQRLARTCVLPQDTVHWARLPGAEQEVALWDAWRTRYRRQTVRHERFPEGEAPAHVPQHAVEQALWDAARREELVQLAPGCRLTGLDQTGPDVIAHTRQVTDDRRRQWRGSYLVGCDGARSTVRKLLGIPFPGRTAVQRYAVATVRADLPWPGEAGLHRGPSRGEVTARPLTGGRWRLDWPLPADGGLVTPDTVLERLHTTLAGWHDGDMPPYELLDTGVHVCHQRLARHWRSGRAFLAGDAAHLLGALGTQQVAEGLRDADNLAWKLGVAWHQGHADPLLDSYEAERRAAVGARLRAVDQALPLARGRSGIFSRLTGRRRGRLALLTDGHLGRGVLGAAADYRDSPLAPARRAFGPATDTPPGTLVADVPVLALDGAGGRLRAWLGGPLLLVLTAPGARVWDARHWLTAGLMPELAAAAGDLPLPTELLVTEEYPGATAHTLLVVRPDGHLAAVLPGGDHEQLHSCVRTLRGPAPDASPATGPPGEAAEKEGMDSAKQPSGTDTGTDGAPHSA